MEEQDGGGDGEGSVDEEALLENNAAQSSGNKARLQAEYFAIMQAIPPGWQDEVCVLWGTVLSVARCGTEDGCNPATDEDAASAASEQRLAVLDPQGRLVGISSFGSPTMFRGLLAADDQAGEEPKAAPQVYMLDDERKKGQLSKQFQRSSLDTTTLLELRSFQSRAIGWRQMGRLLGFAEFPTRPQMSAVERGIKESELMTFTDLQPDVLHRGNQLRIFNDLVSAQTKPLPNFTGAAGASLAGDAAGLETILDRRFFRNLPPMVLSAVLSAEASLEPLALRHYYEMTDQLLLALHWPPPDRRNCRQVWQYTGAGESTPEWATARLRDLKLDCATITPAGRWLMKVHRICLPRTEEATPSISTAKTPRRRVSAAAGVSSSTSSSSGRSGDLSSPWFTAHLDGTILGVRLRERDLSAPPTAAIGANGPSACSMFVHSASGAGSRLVFFPGPTPNPLRKPDKLGTVCMLASWGNGLRVTICSNGNIKIASGEQFLQSDTRQQHLVAHPMFLETHRLVGPNMTILRSFRPESSHQPSHQPPRHPFSYEILYLDGTRELHVDRSRLRTFLKKLKKSPPKLALVEFEVLEKLPADASMMRFTCEGCIEFFREDGSGELVSCEASNGVLQRSLLTRHTDATSGATVSHFSDGRLAVLHRDGRREVVFPDGTCLVHDPASAMALFSRRHLHSAQTDSKEDPHLGSGWPAVEMDLDVDGTSRSHSRGMEVPINKGGQRVRSRISLPDGTAVTVSAACLCISMRKRISVLAHVYLCMTMWSDMVSCR